MTWLSGPQQVETQRCPMCNDEIQIPKLQAAIAEQDQAKGSGFFGSIFNRSPKKAPPAISGANEAPPAPPGRNSAGGSVQLAAPPDRRASEPVVVNVDEAAGANDSAVDPELAQAIAASLAIQQDGQ